MGGEVTGRLIDAYGGHLVAGRITATISGSNASWATMDAYVRPGTTLYLDATNGRRIELHVRGCDVRSGMTHASVTSVW
ncbi:hypothetical protein [Paludisphaera mucosa]|uniref:Uncharacterized protein n=1 Tax=Paludisphaera mucosa TaxID=3030827 RepID=A0ABT6FLT4_9BACT|nr:hypothetical protein [Paludisphaera mucosa]MDG3008489.1 hypothetical protein [Paludisphaera mucosa]